MCLGVNVRKAGHGGERGVIIKQMCVGMCFIRANVHMCACPYTVLVLIVFVWTNPMSLSVGTRCVWTCV